jgi:hypothetical protein
MDGAGDVIAAGSLRNSIGAPDGDFTVVKLAAGTGNEQWRASLAGGHARALAVDSAGDVVAAGNLDGDLAIVKFAGATGAQLWQRLVDGSARTSDKGVNAVALDAFGDVIAVGSLHNSDTFTDFAAVKLSGVTGSELWTADVGLRGTDEAGSIALDVTGDALSAGFAYLGEEDSFDMSILKLSSVDGAVVVPIPDADVSPSSVDFGNRPTGSPKTRTLVIANLGDADLNVGSVYLASGGTAGFQLSTTPAPPAVLARNGTVEAAVTLLPETPGPYADELRMATDDPQAPFVSVPISAFVYLALCNDGIDNDADGSIDWNGGSLGEPADPGCIDASDNSERDGTGRYPCDDGYDNDNDGRMDYDPITAASPAHQFHAPAGSGDPACRDASWFAEIAQCQDGVDNDGDGKMDYDAGYSANGVPHPNGADPQCAGKPWKDREGTASPQFNVCGLGAELTFPLAVLIWLSRMRRRRVQTHDAPLGRCVRSADRSHTHIAALHRDFGK